MDDDPLDISFQKLTSSEPAFLERLKKIVQILLSSGGVDLEWLLASLAFDPREIILKPTLFLLGLG